MGLLKKFLPELIISAYRRYAINKRFVRLNTDFSEIQQIAQGHESKYIFNKTLAAARLVRDGMAVYERDSVVF